VEELLLVAEASGQYVFKNQLYYNIFACQLPFLGSSQWKRCTTKCSFRFICKCHNSGNPSRRVGWVEHCACPCASTSHAVWLNGLLYRYYLQICLIFLSVCRTTWCSSPSAPRDCTKKTKKNEALTSNN
jgi:hypothetical protein